MGQGNGGGDVEVGDGQLGRYYRRRVDENPIAPGGDEGVGPIQENQVQENQVQENQLQLRYEEVHLGGVQRQLGDEHKNAEGQAEKYAEGQAEKYAEGQAVSFEEKKKLQQKLEDKIKEFTEKPAEYSVQFRYRVQELKNRIDSGRLDRRWDEVLAEMEIIEMVDQRETFGRRTEYYKNEGREVIRKVSGFTGTQVMMESLYLKLDGVRELFDDEKLSAFLRAFTQTLNGNQSVEDRIAAYGNLETVAETLARDKTLNKKVRSYLTDVYTRTRVAIFQLEAEKKSLDARSSKEASMDEAIEKKKSVNEKKLKNDQEFNQAKFADELKRLTLGVKPEEMSDTTNSMIELLTSYTKKKKTWAKGFFKNDNNVPDLLLELLKTKIELDKEIKNNEKINESEAEEKQKLLDESCAKIKGRIIEERKGIDDIKASGDVGAFFTQSEKKAFNDVLESLDKEYKAHILRFGQA